MEEGLDARETGLLQSILMRLHAVWDQHLLQGRALASDLELAVALRGLEVGMHLGQECVVIAQGDLLGQDQRPTRSQPSADALQQRQALLGREELQGQVQHHETGIGDGDIGQIGTDRLQPTALDRLIEPQPQLIEHRWRPIDGIEADGGVPVIQARRQPGQDAGAAGAERAAKIIDARAWLHQAGTEQADQAHQFGQAGHRAGEHVGEDPRHALVEDEITARRIGARVKGVNA